MCEAFLIGFHSSALIKSLGAVELSLSGKTQEDLCLRLVKMSMHDSVSVQVFIQMWVIE